MEERKTVERGGSPDAKAVAATESCPRSFRSDSPLLQFKSSSISLLVSQPILSPLPFPSYSVSFIFSPICYNYFLSKRSDVQSPCDPRELCIDAFCCQCALYYIPWSVVCLPIVKRWRSAAAPERLVRREQGCKLLAINREQGGILLEQTKPRHQPIGFSLI